jgi:hypothetical protein
MPPELIRSVLHVSDVLKDMDPRDREDLVSHTADRLEPEHLELLAATADRAAVLLRREAAARSVRRPA